MLDRLFISTQSMTGRLASFFVLLSIVVGVFCYAIFSIALTWSEDRVGERRVLLDRDIAVERFIAGEQGRIELDVLTVAYNDLTLVPELFSEYLDGKKHFIGETDEETESHMLYLGEYVYQGEAHPIILISEIDKIEFTTEEMLLPVIAVLGMVSVLMFSFGSLLYKLSQKLIEPINELTRQLEEHRGEVDKAFVVSELSAKEFHSLTKGLNHYRSEVSSMIQREQAFARYASHELRTPLTLMQGSADLLSRGEKTDFQARQISRISQATYQMKTMVDALLSLVRYERSEDDIPLRSLAKEELERILEQSQVQAEEKRIAFDIQAESSPEIQASEAVMNMIIGNLIRNAIAASEQGMIRIRMNHNELSVWDEGEGLNPDSRPEGHGLGLLIVEHLCQRFGWNFRLANHPGGGCQARISFHPHQGEAIRQAPE